MAASYRGSGGCEVSVRSRHCWGRAGCGWGVSEGDDDAQELGRVSLHIHLKAVQTRGTSKSC